MRSYFLLISFIFQLAAAAQDSTKYTVTIKLDNLLQYSYPKKIDTVNIYNSQKILAEQQTEVEVKDQTVVLNNLPPGEYTVSFRSFEFAIPDCPLLICKECQNSSSSMIHRLQEGKSAVVTAMHIWPHYKNGAKQLKQDFFKSLTKKETRKLRSFSKTFVIDFIVLKSKTIVDITIFDTRVIPGKIRKIMLKGVLSLNEWEPAIVNGRQTDGKYTIKAAALFED